MQKVLHAASRRSHFDLQNSSERKKLFLRFFFLYTRISDRTAYRKSMFLTALVQYHLLPYHLHNVVNPFVVMVSPRNTIILSAASAPRQQHGSVPLSRRGISCHIIIVTAISVAVVTVIIIVVVVVSSLSSQHCQTK